MLVQTDSISIHFLLLPLLPRLCYFISKTEALENMQKLYLDRLKEMSTCLVRARVSMSLDGIEGNSK